MQTKPTESACDASISGHRGGKMKTAANKPTGIESLYSGIIGRRVVGVVRGGDFIGLRFDDGTIAWIEQDEEGNGPGFLRIQKT